MLCRRELTNGALVLSTIANGTLVEKRYVGYTVAEAKRMFKLETRETQVYYVSNGGNVVRGLKNAGTFTRVQACKLAGKHGGKVKPVAGSSFFHMVVVYK